tara:strand:+ start:3844 stop:4212 length:369 start_codon:yes stop_codon:yes gene_type:complete
MASLSIALPLELDSGDGFVMNKNFQALIRQNLKMLILTSPGERVMEPSFGVGVKNYLFSNISEDIPIKIETKIREQVKIYLPSISIANILFDSTNLEHNKLGIMLVYSIPKLGIKDLLEFTI